MFLRSSMLLSPGECQLAKKGDGLPVPIQHKYVVLVHDRVVTTTNGLLHMELLASWHAD